MFSKVHSKASANVTQEQLEAVNDLTTRLLAFAIHHIGPKPKPQMKLPLFASANPTTEKELLQMILLNLFDGCAMTYQAFEAKSLMEANTKRSTIAGEPCVKYFTGSSFEGIGCASPKEYSDFDTMNVLMKYKASVGRNETRPESGLLELESEACVKPVEVGTLLADVSPNPDLCTSLNIAQDISLSSKQSDNIVTIPEDSSEVSITPDDTDIAPNSSTSAGIAINSDQLVSPVTSSSEAAKPTPDRLQNDLFQASKQPDHTSRLVDNIGKRATFVKEENICEHQSKISNDNRSAKLSDQDQIEKPSTNSPRIKVVMLFKGSYPGYVKLLDTAEARDLHKITASLNYGPVIRTGKSEYLLAHEFEFDNAIAVECDEWPEDAYGWETRDRPSNWPHPVLIQECIKTPCSIVCKSHALNPNDRNEWRYSFARHEGLLLRALSFDVKMIYTLSKILLKQLALKEGVLTTYHLKTLFLWYCEQVPFDRFATQHLDENVIGFLSFVIQHLDQHRFPNYFIPSNNMIAHIEANEIEAAKKKITSLAGSLIEVIPEIQTGKHYPFKVGEIAVGVRESKYSECTERLRSNFITATVHQLILMHLPSSSIMWMFISCIPALKSMLDVENVGSNLTDIKNIMNKDDNILKIALEVLGNEYVEIVMIACSLGELTMSPHAELLKSLLDQATKALNDSLTISHCASNVIGALSFQLGVSATEKSCIALRDCLTSAGAVDDIFMLTLKKIYVSLGTEKYGDESDYVLACLVAVVNVFKLSTERIEVGIATTMRLHNSKEIIQSFIVLCDLVGKADIKNVLKHLTYAVFIHLKDGHKSEILVPETGDQATKNQTGTQELTETTTRVLRLNHFDEATKFLQIIRQLCDESVLEAGTDVFRLVVAAIVFQKLTAPIKDIATLNNFLELLKSSKLSHRVEAVKELENDLQTLCQDTNSDLNSAFQFAVFYTRKCIASVGVVFSLSVLDELLQPHFTLGILSAAATELYGANDIDSSIAANETWIARSTGAPISQNPQLVVTMYGLLGHLFHIKAELASDSKSKGLQMSKASVMFKTALKEKTTDTSVIVNYMLFCLRTNRPEFEKWLGKVSSSGDISAVSSYFAAALPLFVRMEDVYRYIETQGSLTCSSFAFAHYLAIFANKIGCQDEPSIAPKHETEHHLKAITSTTVALQSMLEVLNMCGMDTADARKILEDTRKVSQFAARVQKQDCINTETFVLYTREPACKSE